MEVDTSVVSAAPGASRRPRSRAAQRFVCHRDISTWPVWWRPIARAAAGDKSMSRPRTRLERGERGIRREPYQLRQLEEGRGWCQAYLLLPSVAFGHRSPRKIRMHGFLGSDCLIKTAHITPLSHRCPSPNRL